MESSKSDSESPDQAEFRGDNKCAQCMQVLYLQSEQVNGIHNLEDIHIQSSTSTAPVSEVDSDRRAARASRAWPLPGSGARARASGSGQRAQQAARRIMSHGRVTIFGALTRSQPARIQHRIHASIGKFHACSHACMTGCLAGWYM